MPIRIPRLQGLSPREAAIEAQVVARVEADTDAYFAAYEKRFDNELNADNAAELFPEYAASSRARTWNREAVHAAARWIAFELFQRRVTQPPSSGLRDILFTAGGTGSGKSTSIADLRGETGILILRQHARKLRRSGEPDRVGASVGTERRCVLHASRSVEAFGGVLDRSMHEGRGRTVQIRTHLESHRLAAKTVSLLLAKYASHERVRFVFFEHQQAVAEFRSAWLRKFEGSRYTEIEKRLRAVLETYLVEGKIDREIYERTAGHEL